MKLTLPKTFLNKNEFLKDLYSKFKWINVSEMIYEEFSSRDISDPRKIPVFERKRIIEEMGQKIAEKRTIEKENNCEKIKIKHKENVEKLRNASEKISKSRRLTK